MRNFEIQDCANFVLMLPEYRENTLSARQVWDLEKHLSRCQDCTELSRQLAATVALLHEAPRRDTADDFMAKLHARLDNVEQETKQNRSIWDAIREMTAGMTGSLMRYRVPALSMGLAASLLALALVTTHRQEIPSTQKPLPKIVASAQKHSISDNPFEDIVAENLANTTDSEE